MEEMNENELQTGEEPGYIPRPAWQVWAARIGLVIFIGFVILQMLLLSGGGL